MNRPTFDVDDLLGMADEAFAAGDYPQAVTILRKAAAVAPLRKDIRNRLAIALEGTPVTSKRQRRQPVELSPTLQNSASNESFSPNFTLEDDVEEEPGGREAISLIARKAFEAAAGHTAKAGVATRNLTNLLQQGIQSWKSSLSAAPAAATTQAQLKAEVLEAADSEVSNAIRSGVFTPENELDAYLKRASTSETGLQSNVFDPEDDQDLENEETSRVLRPNPVSSKSTKAPSPRKKTSRPSDVEDVLAAGIGGFIEAVSHANKTKIIYGCVYVAMAALFSYACFDVSRKFPQVEPIPGGQVAAASMGALNLDENQAKSDAISEARNLVSGGKTDEAIALLRSHLESGRLLQNRDQLRTELAALLNGIAEQHLRANEFSESVTRYREAVKVLPSDEALQLRLGNALYYQGSLAEADSSVKTAALTEAESVLKGITEKNSSNIQATRLLALVQEARGSATKAKGTWGKVKKLAAAGSPEYNEAQSHLK